MGINLWEMIVILLKLRKEIAELKSDFYSAKIASLAMVLYKVNFLFIVILGTFCYMVGGILIFFLNLKWLGVLICTISCIYIITSVSFERVCAITLHISKKILRYFLKYGKVVGKQDWKNVKKYCKMLYKDLRSKESYGYCYFYSRILALYIDDAQLMYCAIKINDEERTGHSVIVKNHCVYDTNTKFHYDYDEYIEETDAIIYKIFSKEEYEKESFFDDIRSGFIEWCKEKNAYCQPE